MFTFKQCLLDNETLRKKLSLPENKAEDIDMCTRLLLTLNKSIKL